MAEEKTEKVETSLMHKGRKTVWHLQKMKEKGEKIVMVGPGNLDPLFSAWADAAGVDMIRFVAPGENAIDRSANLQSHLRQVRKMAPNAHFNIVCETFTVADNRSALETTSALMADQADSILIMGITNDKLQYLSDNHIPVFGHVGALSGWQTTNIGGYKRVGKTAEDAYRIYRTAYEYQECGMKGMTIELVPAEVAQTISEKLSVPVVGIAAGAPCDGSEMVVWDLLGIVPAATVHAKQYAQLPQVCIGAYGAFINDVKTGAYPQPENGYPMDAAELEKFKTMVENDTH
jgi:3-methyl-2-oxobutanoate hydroxymethyltransferase